MVTERPAEVLHDRRSEREALGRLLGAVRGGQSRVLVICGEPGVGKTALLESAIGSASGFRVPAPSTTTYARRSASSE